ncbi:TetR/AcrR family transcriptional regulator [Pseudonocardia spirodelae]|uniref:TetR/AcrR family transcriptional regulator n=1 Tax=Pseudonocardia spirodelae TaxID=3133431 RepID=A0ABU8T6B0_9PSEU
MSEGRTYGGVAAADRVAQRRARLLDAGLALFGTEGYRRVTVRRICTTAHVAQRNFYEEFGTTEDLLVAVYTRAVDHLESVVWSAVPEFDGDLGVLARHALDALFRVLQEQPALARVVWFEVLGVSERVEAVHTDRTETFVTLLGRIADTLGVPGDGRDPQRRLVLRALVGGVSEVARRWIRDGFDTARADLVEALTALMLAGARLPGADR